MALDLTHHNLTTQPTKATFYGNDEVYKSLILDPVLYDALFYSITLSTRSKFLATC